MTAGTDPHAGHAHAATPDRSVRPALVGDAGAIARIQCRTLESLLVDAVGESAPRIPEDTVRAQWASTLSAPRKARSKVIRARPAWVSDPTSAELAGRRVSPRQRTMSSTYVILAAALPRPLTPGIWPMVFLAGPRSAANATRFFPA